MKINSKSIAKNLSVLLEKTNIYILDGKKVRLNLADINFSENLGKLTNLYNLSRDLISDILFEYDCAYYLDAEKITRIVIEYSAKIIADEYKELELEVTIDDIISEMKDIPNQKIAYIINSYYEED